MATLQEIKNRIESVKDTQKITNATDAELGDAMPHFEVTDFTQEEVA